MERVNRSIIEQGFTLIELVIVIVLLGILAATALPKFVDLTSQARTAANSGFAGGLATAVSQARGAWLAQGSPSTITLADGTIIHFNSAGFPDGVGAAAQSTNAGCVSLWTSLLQNPATATAGATGCGTTTPCYNTVYAAGPPETCTYTVNNFTGPHGVTYTISGTGAGGVVAF